MLLLLITKPATATCEQSLALCDTAVNVCGDLVDKQKTEIGLCRLGLTQSLNHSAMLDLELKDTQESLNAWYRNPFVMVALGLVVGGVAAGVALK